MRKKILFIVLFFVVLQASAQKRKFDSLASQLSVEKKDTSRVKLMWMMADASNLYNPDTALQLAQRALYLSQKIRYTEGESRSLGVLAMSFRELDDYQKALQFFLQKLKIEENRNSPRNLASVLINIGILYIYLEQYDEALSYYKRANAIIKTYHVADLEYYISNNLGDLYERLNKTDSAFVYFNNAIAIATKMNNGDLTGTSIVGLGHLYMKKNDFINASQSYNKAILYLDAANDEGLICEASLGLAKLYDAQNRSDSAVLYALQSYTMAKKDGFESRQLEAANLLNILYKKRGDITSAYNYLSITQTLKDSISGKEKIRSLQVISGNEELRQNDIAESKLKAAEERHQQLQMLAIGLCIPLLFLLTLLLNRIRVHQRIIRFMGVISLLMLFEYLLLLLHSRVEEFTNHLPAYEILIFVAIASILVPSHHRIERWMIEKLTTKHASRIPKRSKQKAAAVVPPNVEKK